MELSVIVGIAGTAAGMLISYFTFMRQKSHDDRNEGEQNGVILTELGYIKANTEEIKAEQREQRKINQEVLTRLTAVEVKADRAHSRIDHIEKMIDK